MKNRNHRRVPLITDYFWTCYMQSLWFQMQNWGESRIKHLIQENSSWGVFIFLLAKWKAVINNSSIFIIFMCVSVNLLSATTYLVKSTKGNKGLLGLAVPRVGRGEGGGRRKTQLGTLCLPSGSWQRWALVLSLILLCIQSRTSASRMVPPTFR